MKSSVFLIRVCFFGTFAILIAALFLFQRETDNQLAAGLTNGEEVFVSAPAQVEKKYDYTQEIPVFSNGMEYNLYDLMSEQQILYFKREGCEDCEQYNDVIIERLSELDYPYMTIEVSKDPAKYDGMAIPSSVVKAIGISQVPTLAFIVDGEWITRIENEFTAAGAEIALTCQQVFH